MNLGELPASEIDRRLLGHGLGFRTGPFAVRVRSDAPTVRNALALLYRDYPAVADDEFCDFTLELWRPHGLRRWVRPQVVFSFDGAPAFEPLPLGHAYALLEWAMNWCISRHAHQYLILHAAVIERGGRAAILPAPPGSGKSTLCAALIQRGWRLLSDELALIALDEGGALHALARPVSLKNQSLAVISNFERSAVLSEPTHDTAKGTVAHMRVPAEHVQRVHETARARWVVFPRYLAGSEPRMAARAKADTMIAMTENAFNYSLLGLAGFQTLADLIDGCDAFDFEYSRLDDAVAHFDRLAAM